MKRCMSIFALVAVLAAALCACAAQQAQPLNDIFSTIKTDYNVTDMVEFSGEADLQRFYGIEADDVSEFAGGINNSGVNQEEIVLIKAADTDAAARVEEKLSNRLQSKLNETKNYNPEQYAIVEQCTVDVDNVYVSMIISENASAMKKIYQEGIGV